MLNEKLNIIQIIRSRNSQKNAAQAAGYDDGKHDLTLIKVAKKIADDNEAMSVHYIDRLSNEQKTALDVLKWCYAVARLPPDSPRLNYYVTWWNVLGKIDHAKTKGTFNETIARCPYIGLEHLPAGLAAIEAWREWHVHGRYPKSTAERIAEAEAQFWAKHNPVRPVAKPAKPTRKKAGSDPVMTAPPPANQKNCDAIKSVY